MGSIVVDVMLKPEILDPQGKAVHGALPAARLRRVHATSARASASCSSVDGEVTDERLAAAREAAETLLSNPVIEDFVLGADARCDVERRRRRPATATRDRRDGRRQ